jgi:Fic family protein
VRSFDEDAALLHQVPGGLTRALARADVGRGLEGLHVSQMPGLLQQLAFSARVQSIKASSALEGVVVADELRADRIIGRGAANLRGRSEQELAGYRDALDYVWQYDWRPLNVGLVLHLHRLLLAHTVVPGGTFKSEDNLVVDRLPDGRQEIRFQPVSARNTPWFTEELLGRYLAQREADEHHPLLLIGLAVLDLLVIHPFEDGNGRVARILTNALLSEAGYGVARYVSLEQLIAESADGYYASLLASTRGWHEAEHDPWPWLTYFVGQVGDAYGLFEQRAASGTGGGGKRGRVKQYVLQQAPARFRISDVRASLPGISDGTIRNALDDLRDERKVDVDGPGRGATWFRL